VVGLLPTLRVRTWHDQPHGYGRSPLSVVGSFIAGFFVGSFFAGDFLVGGFLAGGFLVGG
jgi:hypothetical protein